MTDTAAGWKCVSIDAAGGIRSQHGEHQWTVGEWAPEQTPVLCTSGYHHSPDPMSALFYVPGNGLARTEARGAAVVETDTNERPKSAHAQMRLTEVRRWSERDDVALQVYVARKVLHLFEQERPGDLRVRQCIEAKEAWLANPTDETRAARAAAGAAARDAALADFARWIEAHWEQMEPLEIPV